MKHEPEENFDAWWCLGLPELGRAEQRHAAIEEGPVGGGRVLAVC